MLRGDALGDQGPRGSQGRADGGPAGDGVEPVPGAAEEVPVLRRSGWTAKKRSAQRELSAPYLAPADYDTYFGALRDSRSIDLALTAIGKHNYSLDQARRKKSFRDHEKAVLGFYPPKAKPYEYLYQLRKCYGNVLKARRKAGLRAHTVNNLRTEKWFKEREDEILEALVESAKEQNVRIAVGAKAKVKDTNHLRWFLAHVDKDGWGDTKVIEHHVSGKIDVETIDAEILELTSGA